MITNMLTFSSFIIILAVLNLDPPDGSIFPLVFHVPILKALFLRATLGGSSVGGLVVWRAAKPPSRGGVLPNPPVLLGGCAARLLRARVVREIQLVLGSISTLGD